MKKTIIKISLFAIVAIGLASCVNRTVCPEYKGVDGLMHTDKDACSKSTYLLGFVPLS
jgi:chemotaxis receptor (MCP) glutamine deamidase CheD